MEREYLKGRPRGWTELGHRFSTKVRRMGGSRSMGRVAGAAMPCEWAILVLAQSVTRPWVPLFSPTSRKRLLTVSGNFTDQG